MSDVHELARKFRKHLVKLGYNPEEICRKWLVMPKEIMQLHWSSARMAVGYELNFADYHTYGEDRLITEILKLLTTRLTIEDCL